MNPALSSRLNELAAACGPVPRGPGHYDNGGAGAWVQGPAQTPARLIERMLMGDKLSEPETVWFHRFMAIFMVSTVHAANPASVKLATEAAQVPESHG